MSSLTNLAVGGTSVFTGLARLIKTGAHKAADILLIEYSLNDAEFSKAAGVFDLWGEAYEGLVRKALTENPRLTIIPVILGRRSGVYRRRICQVCAGVHTISRRYALDAIDINEMLQAMYPSAADFEALYADDSHYARPFTTKLIGETIARHIAGRRGCQPVDKVRPVYEKNLSTAKYLDNFDAVAGGHRKTYKNSVFNADTTFLPPGSSVSAAITGRVHLVEFVSTPSSRDLVIRLNGDSFRQHTTRKTFAGSNRDFLLGAILPEFHTGRSLKGVRASLEFEVQHDSVSAVEGNGNEVSGALMPPISDRNPGFSLEGILYSGRLVLK